MTLLPQPAGDFRLVKWYFDLIGGSGRAYLGYLATLAWGALRLGYASHMTLDEQGALRTRGGFRGGFRRMSLPEAADGRIVLASAGARGTWEAKAPSIERTLWRGAGGAVQWDCVAPRAEAAVELDDGWSAQGAGYVERLTLTVKPWELPIEELRWGHFLSDPGGPPRSIVWIEWRGPRPLQLLLVDGVEVDAAEIGDTEIRDGRGTLRLEAGTTIRAGRLGETVLRRAGRLRRAAPLKLLALDERKWLARGRYAGSGIAPSQGSAIHEVVRW